MTREELEVAIKENPELLEGYVPVDSITEKINQAVEEKTKGLIKKRNELLEKVADPKRKQDLELAQRVKEILSGVAGIDEDEITPDKADVLEEIFGRLQNPEADEESIQLKRNYSKLERELKKIQEGLGERESALNEAESFIQDMLTKKELVSKFMDQGCSRVQAEANAQFMLSQANFEIVKGENGQREAVVKDSGLKLNEHFDNWLESEEAQDLMPAKPTSGGGASGNHAGGKGKLTLDQIEKLGSREERLAAMKELGYNTD